MRTTLRCAVVVLFPAAALLLLGAPASAHVTVSGPDATAGGYGKLVFRVPNESDTASTTQVRVSLPADAPLASVRTVEVPGWKSRIDTETLDEPVSVGDLNLTEVARTVTWTAQRGKGIDTDEFAEFELSVGPFVDDPAATYEFAAIQTYDDGQVVTWNQPHGSEEVQHPAPTLRLDGSTDGHSEEVHDVGEDSGGSDTTARVLGGGELLLGGAALGVAVSGRRRTPVGGERA